MKFKKGDIVEYRRVFLSRVTNTGILYRRNMLGKIVFKDTDTNSDFRGMTIKWEDNESTHEYESWFKKVNRKRGKYVGRLVKLLKKQVTDINNEIFKISIEDWYDF